jgi:hypothetical protein
MFFEDSVVVKLPTAMHHFARRHDTAVNLAGWVGKAAGVLAEAEPATPSRPATATAATRANCLLVPFAIALPSAAAGR